MYDESPGRQRILVFNCHEAWVYQLRVLDRPLDIVVGLKGRRTAGWDLSARPAPGTARFVSLDEARAEPEPYDCVITHNLTDLIESKATHAPRIFVLHNTLEHLIAEQHTQTAKDEIRASTSQYVNLLGIEAVAVSELKARSWGLTERVVPCFADVKDCRPYIGDVPRGLRIANDIRSKRRTLWWEFHEAAFESLPVTLVGHNDDIPGVAPARSWDDLKDTLSHHRFFIHTADPQLEDGYNMATLEAMAAGLPVIGNAHPSSPVEHGRSGLLSNDPAEIRKFASLLLENRELALRMGCYARESVARKFPPEKFRAGMLDAIEAAKRKFSRRANVSARYARQ